MLAKLAYLLLLFTALTAPHAIAVEVSGCRVSFYEGVTLEELVNGTDQPAKSVSQHDCPTIALGFIAQPVRVDMTVRRSADDGADHFLVIDYPPLDHLVVRIGGKLYRTGSKRVFGSRPIPTRNFSFPVNFAAGEYEKTVEVFAKTSSSLQLPMTIEPTPRFIGSQGNENLLFGIYYGIIIALILYNLFIFVVVKERAYLYYILYAACYLVFQMTINGIATSHIWPGFPAFTKPIIAALIGFIFVFIFLFMRHFLNIAADHKRLDRLVVALAVVSLLVSTIALKNPALGVITAVAYSIVAAFIVFGIGIYVALQRNMTARIFLVAWGVFLLGIVLIGLKNFGILPRLFITENAMQIGSALEMILLSFGLGYRVRRAEQEKLAAVNEKYHLQTVATQNAAIARTTQMLAHDVRKPFTMMSSFAQMVQTTDASALPDLVKTFLPEMDRALINVNGVIADVMEIGHDSAVEAEGVELGKILQISLNEALRYRKDADVNLTYSINCSRKTQCDPLKIGRVFSNIILNALQAMDYRGDLDFRAEQKKERVIVTVRNSGSYIPEEEISQLFDAFFTKRKKGGTGLGLAICKKIVGEHGGSISCSSSPESGTAFTFDLPLSTETDRFDYELLPKSSAVIRADYERSLNVAETGSGNQDTAALAGLRAKLSKDVSVRVLICDDESIYRSAVRSYLREISAYVDIREVNTTSAALQEVQSFDPHIVIMDVDFDDQSDMNGFDATSRIRELKPHARICIHSSGALIEYANMAKNVGADVFLPKPMAKTHLVKMLDEVLACRRPATSRSNINRLESLIVIDDNAFILDQWEKVSKKRPVRSYDSPEEFLLDAQRNVDLLRSENQIVTDQYFEDGSKFTGLDLAKTLREKGFQGSIFLSTDGDVSSPELNSHGVVKLAKLPSVAIHVVEQSI